MPTYSYACTSCEHRFDIQQSFNDPAMTVCPECEGTLRKLFNSVGIVFKGSGFYRTDSRNGSGGSAGSNGGSASSASDGSSASGGKSESNGSSSTSKSDTSTATKSAPATSGSAA